MPITDFVKTNFETLLRAAAADAHTGETRFIPCAVAQRGGEVVLTPFGHLVDADPYELYHPPFDPGGG